MKIVIAGGRDWKPEKWHWHFTRALLIMFKCDEIVSGACSGADRFGEAIAKRMGIKVTQFPADWSMGKSAGPKRNKAMAEYCDAVILFTGGKGTDSMRNEAKLAGKQILFDERDTE